MDDRSVFVEERERSVEIRLVVIEEPRKLLAGSLVFAALDVLPIASLPARSTP